MPKSHLWFDAKISLICSWCCMPNRCTFTALDFYSKIAIRNTGYWIELDWIGNSIWMWILESLQSPTSLFETIQLLVSLCLYMTDSLYRRVRNKIYFICINPPGVTHAFSTSLYMPSFCQWPLKAIQTMEIQTNGRFRGLKEEGSDILAKFLHFLLKLELIIFELYAEF